MAFAMTFGQSDAKKSNKELWIRKAILSTEVGYRPTTWAKADYDTWMALGTTDYWQKIGIIESGATHGGGDGEKIKDTAGNDITIAETAIGDSSFLNVTKANYETLRAELHNQKVDIQWFTSKQQSGSSTNGNGVLYSNVRVGITAVLKENDVYRVKISYNTESGDFTDIFEMFEVI